MKIWSWMLILAVSSAAMAQTPAAKKAAKAPSPDDIYELTADSKKQKDVPAGKTFTFPFENSKVFPGTTRNITVYVPAQYKAEKPACVYVGFDSLGFGAPVVFDNLIHKNEMPLVIGVGVSPGSVKSSDPKANPRFNRSFEFDGLNGDLASFVLDEVLPEVEKQKTPDGLPILLSKDPNDRCTGGGSTGAIAAFTVAWERPDAFRRVFTAVGTFVGMRGGDRYPVLVRKTEPKPIRIFMQDGSNDQWMGGPEVGDWWMSNQTLERALSFAGYQVEHAWGTGTHGGKHAAAVFPDGMRYLWKDWPSPVTAGSSQNTFLNAILEPNAEWQVVGSGLGSPDSLAANNQGEIFYSDRAAKKSYKLGSSGQPEEYAPGAGGVMAYGPDDRWYVATEDGIRAVDSAGKSTTVADGIRAADILVTSQGTVYASEPGASTSKIWKIDSKGAKQLVDEGLRDCRAIAISPDGHWFAAAETTSHWGYSYRVEADGSLQVKQKYYWFHVPDWAEDSNATDWCMDKDGRLYAATRMGVEVFDRNGRVRCILPIQGEQPTSVCFGGADFSTLYVIAGDKIYARKLKSVAAPAWRTPIQLPPWGAG